MPPPDAESHPAPRRINPLRLLLGGVVCGVVINSSEYFFYDLALGPPWSAALSPLYGALHRGPPANAVGVYHFRGFLLGFFCVWLYTILRHFRGPGTRTALLTAFAVWFSACLLLTLDLLAKGLFPVRLLLIGLLAELPILVAATFAGAWLCRDP